MTDVNRRSFLKGSAIAAAGMTMPLAHFSASGQGSSVSPLHLPEGDIIDVNVNLSHWPFRRVPADEPAVLRETLRANGVARAWAGSYDAIFHKDISAVNARLHELCAGDDIFVPIGAINPMLPDWEGNLDEVQEQYRMTGIRLYPNYHLYDLSHPEFVRLLENAAERGLVVQIVAVMEDARTQHPLVRVPPVNFEPLLDLVAGVPDLQVVVLNVRGEMPRGLMGALAETGQVYFDIARAEGAGPIEQLLEKVPANRVLFGSHAPFFYHEAAVLKMKESLLSDSQATAITRGNAESLLRRASQTN